MSKKTKRNRTRGKAEKLTKEQKEHKREIIDLGMNMESFKKFDSVSELVRFPPKMVLGEVERSGIILFDDSFKIHTKPGEVYVMNYGLYQKINNGNKQQKKYLRPHKHKFPMFFKRYRGQILNGKRILFWRSGGLGDLLFTQPSIKFLKKNYPDSFVGFATSPNNMEFFDNWEPGLVDEVHPIPFYSKILRSYDYHATFEGSIEHCEEAKSLNAYDVFRKVLGLKYDPFEFPVKLIPKEELVKEARENISGDLVLVHMKSTSPARNMETPKWAFVINGLVEKGYSVGIIDSPKGDDFNEQFISRFKFDRNRVFNLSKHSKSISHGIAICSISKALVGIDSSFTHIAAALDKPVYGIYGPFRGELRMKYYEKAAWSEPKEYNECGMFPCFFHSNEVHRCPTIKKNMIPGCISSLDNDKLLQDILSHLERW